MNQPLPLPPAGYTRLSRAAMVLGLSYNQTLRLVLTRELKGQQDFAGHWWVDVESLDAFVGARSTKRSTATTIAEIVRIIRSRPEWSAAELCLRIEQMG